MSEKPITRYVCHSSHILTEGEAALRKDIVVSLDDHEAALAAEREHYSKDIADLNEIHREHLAAKDARIAELENAIKDLLDVYRDAPECRFDHHGGCQEHGDTTGDGQCFVALARKLLTAPEGE